MSSSSLLARAGRAAARRPRRSKAALLLGVLALLAGSVAVSNGFTNDFRVPGIEAQRAQDLLAERFPQQSGDQATLVFHGRDGRLTGERREAVTAAMHAIARQPRVDGVEDPFARGHISRDGRTAFASVTYDAEADELGAGPRERLEAATATLAGAGVAATMAGPVVDAGDTGAAAIGELAGVVVALLLLLLVLRSARAALSSLAAAIVGLAAGFAALLYATAFTSVPTLAPTLAAMLGLGAGIDYALLLAARQQEELRAGHAPAEAAARANATAGRSAVTAAGIVVVSICGLAVSGVPFLGRVGVAAGAVVLACAAVCVLLMPGFFGSSGRRMLPRRERRAAAPTAAAAPTTGRSRGLMALPTRHPRSALVVAGLAIAALAYPAASLDLGQPDDGNRPAETTQRQAYDTLAAAFGPGFNGPLVLAVALPEDGSARGVPEALAERIGHDRGVAAVEAPVLNAAGTAAVLTVVPRSAPQDERTAALVDRLRATAIPAVVDGTGARALVGGATARYGDEADRIASRIPVFAAAVVGLSLLLLLVAFRSWWIALLSALFNLASIAAAYGVVQLGFQTAGGAELLGVEPQPVVPYVPLFMFAILFGLSTDYNVFLLSRVREEWRREPDMAAAVRAATRRTGRIITAAGGIMVAVFLGFATDPESTIKMSGIGLASAILIDVTIVRLVLAPAALTLLGKRIWRRRPEARTVYAGAPANHSAGSAPAGVRPG